MLPGFPRHPVGGYRVVYEYANGLAERGHLVRVVYPSLLSRGSHPPGGGAGMAIRRLLAGLGAYVLRPQVTWMDLHPSIEERFVTRLTARAVPDGDVVVATWWATAPFVAQLPADKGRGLHLLQHFEDWGGPEARVTAAWRLPLAKVAVSGWLRDMALGLGVERKHVVHIPNAVDHSVFQIRYPPAERPRRVAFMAAPEPWKGTADAVAVLKMARRRFPDLEAVGFGVARRPPELPAWIEYNQDPQPDALAREVYGNSSIFLYTSEREGWGLPGAEAMACGCAVVSTDSGGVRDYLKHDVTGLLAPPNDVEALSTHLASLLRDDERRQALAWAGADRIRAFTWHRSVARFENVLQLLSEEDR